MAKYIDADKLIAEIKRLHKAHSGKYGCDEVGLNLEYLEDFIDSLQQEQPKELIVMAESFLDVLSKTPFNNKPITDAQAIVKQLLVFLNNPKLYNPDALSQQEQPEVELEKEIKAEWDVIDTDLLRFEEFKAVCFRFYRLGLNARKQ